MRFSCFVSTRSMLFLKTRRFMGGVFLFQPSRGYPISSIVICGISLGFVLIGGVN